MLQLSFLGFDEACRIGSNGSPVLLRAPKIQSQDMVLHENAMLLLFNFRVYRPACVIYWHCVVAFLRRNPSTSLCLKGMEQSIDMH